jgi:hypothetical protein
MRLSARLVGQKIEVVQDGGYGLEARQALSRAGKGAKWDGTTSTWVYDVGHGVVESLREIAETLGADLELDDELRQAGEESAARLAREQQVRVLMQQRIDAPAAGRWPWGDLPAYRTVQAPPPWRHQAIAHHWATRVQALYVAHKPGLGKTRTGVDVIRARIDAGWVRFMTQRWVDAHKSVAGGKDVPATGPRRAAC